MTAKLHVYRSRDREFRWTLKLRNGRKIADSGESYKTRHGAILAARRLPGYAAGAKLVE